MRRRIVLASMFVSTLFAAGGDAHAVGASIVFASNRDGDSEIYSMDADGSNVVQLTFNSAEDYATTCSPDGRRVAFTSERDGNAEIYVMNVDGSGLERLTDDPASDFTPDWSRDGSKIAFVSERDGDKEIFVINSDGSGLLQVTDNSGIDNAPGWSPDGSRIAVHSDRSGPLDIWVIDPDGSNAQNLTAHAALDAMPDFSPDGTQIVFESTRNGPLELYLMDADGGNVQRLTYTGSDNHEPDWSPDGSQILFMSQQGGDYDIMLINPDGGGLVNRTSDSPAMEWGASWLPEVIDDASNGGGTGILAYCNQPVSAPDVHEIYTIHMDGTQKRYLLSTGGGLNHHEWSPDGTQIAAVGYVDASTWSIYTFDADGTNLTRRTFTAGVWDNEPSWPPDGARLAWARIYPSQGYRSEIWVMNADGTDQHYIGVAGDGVRWSPDGTRLLYHKELATLDLWTCNVDGSGEVQLTAGPGNNIAPDWSPDGSRIVFVSTRDGNHEIYTANPDGTALRRLTDNPTMDHSPTWSPDGTLIAFDRDVTGSYRFEVFVMDSSGADVRRVTYSPPDRTSINPDWQPPDTTTVAVYLQQLHLERIENAIRLTWRVEKEAAASDFRVVARQGGGQREVVVTPIGARRFEAVDTDAALRAGGSVVYDLWAVADDGGWDLLATEGVNLAVPLYVSRVVGVYPNPFNPSTTVSFSLNLSRSVRIEIHDVTGRLVTTLVDSRLHAGDHHVRWNGRDALGHEVASGIYLLRFVSGKQVETRKLALIR